MVTLTKKRKHPTQYHTHTHTHTHTSYSIPHTHTSDIFYAGTNPTPKPAKKYVQN